MAYNNWRQLSMLLELLDDPRNDIFIHIDKRAGDFPQEMLASTVKRSQLVFVPKNTPITTIPFCTIPFTANASH
jgi:hypothetical protein